MDNLENEFEDSKRIQIIEKSLLRFWISEAAAEDNLIAALMMLSDYEVQFGRDDFFYPVILDILMDTGQFSDADEILKTAAENDIDPERLNAYLLRILIHKGEYDQALEHINEDIDARRSVAEEFGDLEESELIQNDYLAMQGALLGVLGRYKEAIQRLEDSLMDQDEPGTRFLLGLCYILSEREERGWENIEPVLSSEPHLQDLAASLIGNSQPLMPKDRKLIVQKAKTMLEQFVRYAFDAAGQKEEPFSPDSLNSMSTEEIRQLEKSLREEMSSREETIRDWEILSSCYRRLEDSVMRRRALIRILNWRESDPHANLSNLGLQIDALQELGYQRRTVKKHLQRLLSQNQDSKIAVSLIVEACMDMGIDDLWKALTVEREFGDESTEEEVLEIIRSSLAYNLAHSCFKEAYMDLMMIGYSNWTYREQYCFAQLALLLFGIEKAEMVFESYRPHPMIALTLLDHYSLHPEMEDRRQKLLQYMALPEVIEEEGLNPDYRLLCEEYKDSGLPDTEQLDELAEENRQMERNQLRDTAEEAWEIFDFSLSVYDFFMALELPEKLIEYAPVLITDPRLLLRLTEEEGMDAENIKSVLGYILLDFSQNGCRFPDSIQKLEDFVFDPSYIVWYQSGLDLLSEAVRHIHDQKLGDDDWFQKMKSYYRPVMDTFQFSDSDLWQVLVSLGVSNEEIDRARENGIDPIEKLRQAASEIVLGNAKMVMNISDEEDAYSEYDDFDDYEESDSDPDDEEQTEDPDDALYTDTGLLN